MIEREPGHKSLRESPNIAVILALTSREVKAKLAAFKFPVRILVPLLKVCLRKGLQLKTDLAPRRSRGLRCPRRSVVITTHLHQATGHRLVIVIVQLHDSAHGVIVVTILLHDAAFCIVVIAIDLHDSALTIVIAIGTELHDAAHLTTIVTSAAELHHATHASIIVITSIAHLHHSAHATC